MPNEKSLAEMVWDDLQTQINDIKARVDTIEKRTERSETTSGHPAMTVATAPLAGQGVKQGDELFMDDGSNLADRTGGDGVPAFYDPDSDSWVRTGFLPRRWTGWFDEITAISGAGWARVLDATQLYAMRVNSPGVNGDSASFSFLLKPGNYTLYVLGLTNTSHGKIDWYVDDVLQISGQDWYSAAPIRNVVLNGAITVTNHGLHKLTGVINGQNGASAGFFVSLTKLWIKPSAD